MSDLVLDDEMEAMLRDIEAMGMTPDAPKAEMPAKEAKEVKKVVAADSIDAHMMRTAEQIDADMKAADIVAAGAVVDLEGMTAEDLDAAVASIESEAKVTRAPKKEALVEKAVADAKVVDPDEDIPVAEILTPVTVSVPTPTDPENRVKPSPKTTPKAASVYATSDDIIDTDQIKKDIAINPTDLDTDLIQHPSLQLHYAIKTAGARRAYERLKSGVEILEAKLDSSYREKLGDGTKKPTEAAIRNAVVADPAYASAQTKLIDAQHLWKMCEAVESSFHSRKDILLEVARDRRKEKEGALRVMDLEHTAASGAELRKSVLESLKK